MKKTKKAGKGRESSGPPKAYRMPKTAAELGIDCSICHAPAVWFDFRRGQRDHRAGFVCDKEPAIGHREKLLIKESEGGRAA